MATGHILPGYGQPVSKLRRARSAGCYPLDSATLLELQNASRISKRELQSISENAKALWLKDSTQPTTYDTHFSGPEVTEIQTARPSSSHRHNNPHPHQVFLTNRLHYIEGYHNADTRLGKSPYQNRDKVMDIIKENEDVLEEAPRPKTAYHSLHRWMKPTGVEEHDATDRVMKTLGHNGRQDIKGAGSYRFTPRLRRGDYSMHPGWPTSLPHHRVP